MEGFADSGHHWRLHAILLLLRGWLRGCKRAISLLLIFVLSNASMTTALCLNL
jgi:hypothetical protein